MRVKVFAILVKVFVGLAVCYGMADASARQTERADASSFLITRWTTEQGLPQNSVTSIVQTPDGYLWLGTLGGLARFDGVKFTIFNSGNTPEMVSNRISVLYVGRDGTLWIGGEMGEVMRFRDGRFSLFARPQTATLSQPAIGVIYEDRAGSLWVSAGEGGVTRFVAGDAARAEFYDERHGLPAGAVKSVCEDRDGNLWVCAPKGLAIFHPGQAGSLGNFTVHLNTPDYGKHPIRIRLHPDGGLWVFTLVSLNRFYQGRLTPYLNYQTFVTSVAPVADTADGDLLFGYTSDRIFQVQRASGAVTEHKLEVSSSEPGKVFPIYTLCKDREGNLWVGLIGNGLLRLSRRRVTMFQPVTWYPESTGGPVMEDSRGNLWFGAQEGLFRLAAGVLTTHFTHHYQEREKGWRVDAIYEDRAGDMWFGLINGVARYHEGRFTQYSVPGVDLVQAICEDRQRRLWLGTWQGLISFHEGKTYRQADGLVNNDVKFMMEDHAGALWLGTPDGLSRFENGRFTNYTMAQGLSNNYVRAIHEDADGTLWIGTYGGGLNRMRNGQIAHITTRHGLFDDFISRIIVVGAGDPTTDDTFWLLGNRGIFQVSRRALNEVADGQRSSLNCVVYDKADGMDPSEGQGGRQPAGWRTRDGRFYFPTIRGLAIVEPGNAGQFAPPVVIERVLLEGKELDARQPIEIPPGKGNLEIQYTGLNLAKPEQVQFSFRLSGLNEEWTDVGRRRTAYFPQLEPGDYRFSVRALSPDGVWGEQAASLAFVVRPPWGRTIWFRALLTTALAGLALAAYRGRIAIYRARVERQEAFSRELIASQEQERKRLAAELHDGLGQNLLTINNWARLGLKTVPAEAPEHPFLTEIADTTALTIEDVRRMARNLRPSQLERLGLTSTLEYMLHNTARASGIDFTVELEDIDGLLLPEAEINLFRVMQECANNIVKHSGATQAQLIIKRTAAGLTLHCEDNGRGFSMADLRLQLADSGAEQSAAKANPQSAIHNPQSTGFGLRWMQERVNLLGGKLTLHSAPGAGTTIFISIELGK